MNTLEMKAGDTLPPLVVTLYDGRDAVDLTAATEVRVHLRNGMTHITRAVSGTADGVVTLTWEPGDTKIPGVYRGEVEVVWTPSNIQTWPADQYFTVRIREDLG